MLLAEDGARALEVLRQETVNVVVTDLVMPRMDGHALLRAAKTVQPACDVVLMTAYGTVENAVAAMREGAYDFVSKPVKRAEMLACMDRVLEKQALVVENRALRAELAQARGPVGLIGQSAKMRNLVGTLRQVAPSSATVLILGESGTGKELCARALHQMSPRADAPFVAVNCAALPETILEAELFGAEAGALGSPSPQEPRVGRFERADGGTLLLDEVGDIPLAMQVKLLRVLQEGEFERLGAKAPQQVDVRVVAATHKDLKAQVAAGDFREDLYYRLDVITVSAPPLREREGDIPLLAAHFLKRFSEKHNKQVAHIEQRAIAALTQYAFPGNVRELENAIERAVVLCPSETLRVEDLPDPILAGDAAASEKQETIHFRVGSTMEQLEKAAIDATLRHTAQDKQLTAKLLGISLRTLYRRLEERDARAMRDGLGEVPASPPSSDDAHSEPT